MREEIESFVLLCLLFAELMTPICRCTQNFKQSWITLNFTCYVSLDQGSTGYPTPPPPHPKKKKKKKKKKKNTTTTTNRQPTKNIPVLYIELKKDL